MEPSNPTIQAQPGNLTLEDWHNQYWFTPMHMVEVINPAWAREGDNFVSKDYPFMVEMRHFIIKAGESKPFPGVIANVYLDQVSRLLAQNDDKLGYMGDPNLRRLYYDKLIVAVTNLAPEADATPAYLKPTNAVETPPWKQEPIKETPKPKSKEFKQGDSTYKLVIKEDGGRMHYKDGKLTSEAEYSKAASLL